MKYNRLGNTGLTISAVTYGGIVSAGIYDKVLYPEENQQASDRYVSYAIDHGITYFDVAPRYGNAQEQLGNSLKPYRKDVYLACKTNERDLKGAQSDLATSLKLLHTDHFDVYQLHAINSMDDVDRAFGPDGCMEMISTLKQKGIARNIGFSAHNEAAALRMIELYPFDTVLFPFNWFMHGAHGMGTRLLETARQHGMGVICMKAFIERAWEQDEDKGVFPKSWCKPIDTDNDPRFGIEAMKYALSLGVDTLVPPGNFRSFSFAVEHIDECLTHPEFDAAYLAEKRKTVLGKEFFKLP